MKLGTNIDHMNVHGRKGFQGHRSKFKIIGDQMHYALGIYISTVTRLFVSTFLPGMLRDYFLENCERGSMIFSIICGRCNP